MSVTPSTHLFLGLPFPLDDSIFRLYALATGVFGFILTKWPNHLSLCFSINLIAGVVPTVLLISSFLIWSLLVLFTAFLMHLISHVVIFLSCSFVSAHVWLW